MHLVQPLAEKKGSLDSLFAKQAASASKPAAPASKPAVKPANKSPKKEDTEAMNPDEDDDKEKLRRIEADVKEEESYGDTKPSRNQKDAPTWTSSPSSGKRKRTSPGAAAKKGETGGEKDVEVIELDESDGSDAEVIDVKPPPGKRKKVQAGSSSKDPGDQAETKHSDGEGNEVLTDFFSIESK